MFGQVVKNAPQIVEGHIKEITKQENALSEERLAVCKECPLFSDKAFGFVCDAHKCVDKEGNLYQYPAKGRTCGCGCRLAAKTRLKGAKCVLNKWPK